MQFFTGDPLKIYASLMRWKGRRGKSTLLGTTFILCPNHSLSYLQQNNHFLLRCSFFWPGSLLLQWSPWSSMWWKVREYLFFGGVVCMRYPLDRILVDQKGIFRQRMGGKGKKWKSFSTFFHPCCHKKVFSDSICYTSDKKLVSFSVVNFATFFSLSFFSYINIEWCVGLILNFPCNIQRKTNFQK